MKSFQKLPLAYYGISQGYSGITPTLSLCMGQTVCFCVGPYAHIYKLVRKEEEHSLSAHCPQDLCMTDSLFAKYILNSFVPGKAPVQAEKLPACRQCGAGEDSCRTAMVRGKELIQASVCQGKPKRKMWPCSACPPLSHHAQTLELEAVWMNCRDPR